MYEYQNFKFSSFTFCVAETPPPRSLCIVVTKTRQNAISANPLLQAIGCMYTSACCLHPPQINVTSSYLGSSREAKLVTVFKHSNRLLSCGVRCCSPTNLLCSPLRKQSDCFRVVHHENNRMRPLLYHLASKRTTQRRSANHTGKSQKKTDREKKKIKLLAYGKEYQTLLK